MDENQQKQSNESFHCGIFLGYSYSEIFRFPAYWAFLFLHFSYATFLLFSSLIKNFKNAPYEKSIFSFDGFCNPDFLWE